MKSMPAALAMFAACLAGLGGLAGCAVQPAPHATLPETVRATAPAAWTVTAPPADVDTGAWWAGFGDDALHRLIAAVLDGNLDVQAAAERVHEADALVAQRRGALLPQLDANALAADQRQNVPPPLGYVREAGFGVVASWTPDVFGGERLALLASEAQRSGQQDALDTLRLALAANAASAYIDLRWAQNALRIETQNEAIRARALKLTEDRLHYGLATRLDVVRAQNQLKEVQAGIPRVRSQIEQALSLVAVYAGRTPESAEPFGLAASRAIPVPAQGPPQVLPSTALLRRPDIRTAYAQVERRAAEVGVAEAERYPRFSLDLGDGLLAASYLGLPTLTDNLFNAALNATSPIFHAGRIDADVHASQSRLREAQLGLQQAMLDALKQIEDSRSDLVSTAQQAEGLDGALDASQRALQLSTELYKGGAANFLDVLSAQAVYLRDALALNQARREQAQAAVALYRSLGGGWRG